MAVDSVVLSIQDLSPTKKNKKKTIAYFYIDLYVTPQTGYSAAPAPYCFAFR
jgi:hypothetical protein